jgi:GntR family transcriptional regulator
MVIIKRRSLPLYRQAIDSLLLRFQKSEWHAGDMLPNEFELAAQYGVSQGTMRKALNCLVEEGILVRRQGAGTFVAESKDCLNQATATLLGDPSEYEKIHSEFISLQRIHASEQMAAELIVRRGTALWEVTRSVRAGAHIFGIDRVFFSEAIFPTVDSKRLRYWHANVRQMCLTDFGMHLIEGPVRYRAVLPSQEVMRMLQTGKDTPLLERVRVTLDRHKRPILWGVSTFRTDQFAFCPAIDNI